MTKVLAGKLIDTAELQARVRELGAQISQDYAGEEVLVVGIFKDAFVFCADLLRQIKLPTHVDFIAVSSYGQSTESSGVIRIVKDLQFALLHKKPLATGFQIPANGVLLGEYCCISIRQAVLEEVRFPGVQGQGPRRPWWSARLCHGRCCPSFTDTVARTSRHEFPKRISTDRILSLL